MADFLKIRQSLGTIRIPTIHSTLSTNLYNELSSTKKDTIQKEIKQKEVVRDKAIFFSDLDDTKEAEGEEEGGEADVEPVELKHILIQPLTTTKDISNNPNIKTVTVDPETTISKDEKKKK